MLPFSQTFQAPSFDDKILEVVAVFGSVQMAMSRVIDIQHHRIAQVSLSHHCTVSLVTITVQVKNYTYGGGVTLVIYSLFPFEILQV